MKLYEILINEISTTDMDKTLAWAVNTNKVIAMYYRGDKENVAGWRTGVVPVCFGTNTLKNGKTFKYLRVWQRAGKTLTEVPGWKLFRVDRIKNMNVLSKETVDSPPDAKFNPDGDAQIGNVIAISSY